MAKRRKKKGLGDKVAEVTKALKIDKVVNFIAGEDCGCNERQAYLNTVGVKPIACFNEDNYKLWGSLRKQLKGNIKKHEQELILRNFKELFGIDNTKLCRTCSGAGKVFLNMIESINKVYDSYENNN